MTKKAVLPLLAMPGLFLLSYGLDTTMAAIKSFSSSTFSILDAAWDYLIVDFTFAGVVLLLVWLVLAARERRLLTGWLWLAGRLLP
jgi:hypothetical protein